jgi:hypothetical protein
MFFFVPEVLSNNVPLTYQLVGEVEPKTRLPYARRSCYDYAAIAGYAVVFFFGD